MNEKAIKKLAERGSKVRESHLDPTPLVIQAHLRKPLSIEERIARATRAAEYNRMMGSLDEDPEDFEEEPDTELGPYQEIYEGRFEEAAAARKEIKKQRSAPKKPAKKKVDPAPPDDDEDAAEQHEEDDQ